MRFWKKVESLRTFRGPLVRSWVLPLCLVAAVSASAASRDGSGGGGIEAKSQGTGTVYGPVIFGEVPMRAAIPASNHP